MQIRVKCDRCAERRCRTHCRCGRNGWATGQAAGRPSPLGIAQAKPQAKAQAKAKAQAVAAPAPAVPPVILPTSRPSMVSVDLLETTEWFQEHMTKIRGARHVIIGSYQYDHPGITTSLLGRLEGRDAFDLTAMVDKGCFDARTPYHQQGRLDRLRRASAEIILCRGQPPLGSFHTQAAVIDRRVAFVGSAKLT